MANDLVRKLRDNPDYRKQIAMDVMSYPSPDKEALREIYRMINGEEIYPDYMTRIFFPKKTSLRYSLEDQLAGVEALGESKEKKALDFLAILYTPGTNEKYQNAKGGLKLALEIEDERVHMIIRSALKNLLDYFSKQPQPDPFQIIKSLIDKPIKKEMIEKQQKIIDERIQKTCPSCGGSGKWKDVRGQDCTGRADVLGYGTCETCRGSGIVYEAK